MVRGGSPEGWRKSLQWKWFEEKVGFKPEVEEWWSYDWLRVVDLQKENEEEVGKIETDMKLMERKCLKRVDSRDTMKWTISYS